jgi:hypothetical protein
MMHQKSTPLPNMNQTTKTSPVRLAAAFSVALCLAPGVAGCSSAGRDGERHAERERPILNALAARDAMAAAAAKPVRNGVELFGKLDPEALMSTDKIRNGTLIDYDNVVGNGVVFIENSRYSCTAQVINTWFLLTAGHCVANLMPDGADMLDVSFTHRNGSRVVKYSDLAVGAITPNWSSPDKDIGIIVLPGSFNNDVFETCHGTLSECSSSQADTAENAAFQFFMPGFTPAVLPLYAIVGYGVTSHAGTNDGTLRAGVMAKTSAGFTANNEGLVITMGWTSATQARPCFADSGSPLVFSTQGQLGYTGVFSSFTNCSEASGSSRYSGLTLAQFNWIASVMADVATQGNLGFACAVGTNPSTGVGMFHCDNDGSLYGQ